MMPRNTTDEAYFGTSAVAHKMARLTTIVASKHPVSRINDKWRIWVLSTLPNRLLHVPSGRKLLSLILRRWLGLLWLIRVRRRRRPRSVLPTPRIPQALMNRRPGLVLWRRLGWRARSLEGRRPGLLRWRLTGLTPWLRLPNPPPSFRHLLPLEHRSERLLLTTSSPEIPREADLHRRFLEPI